MRHGPTHWTTHGEEDRHAGGSARGVPGALRGPQPQRQNRGVVRGPHAAIHGLVHFAGDHRPFGSSLDRPRAVRAGSPSPGLRAQHGPWLRASPEDPVLAGAPDGLHPGRHHDALELARVPRTIVPTFSEEQLQGLLAAPDRRTWVGIRDRAILLVLLDTLIRVSELVGLDAEDTSCRTGTRCRCPGILATGSPPRLLGLSGGRASFGNPQGRREKRGAPSGCSFGCQER